ncbi:MAG: hypothetical protein KAQ94_09240 [Arcobacteraceae bacterium]|nr:hypothetical protein [Arcobacteraceae bacterium]
MENLKEQLEKDIKVLVRPLKDDMDELVEILRRRLTKKEWKYYKCKLSGASEDETCIELRCDKERLETIAKQTVVKINQEKIKHELMA